MLGLLQRGGRSDSSRDFNSSSSGGSSQRSSRRAKPLKAKKPPKDLRAADAIIFHQVTPSLGCCEWLRLWALRVVASGPFAATIVLLILANAAVLALEQYPIVPRRQSIAEMINFGLSAVFAVEMSLKMYALGFEAYFRDRFNVFDAVVVLVSAIEIAISPPDFLVGGDDDSSGGAALSGLRTFRIVRVLKLARSLVSLRVLLETILRSLQDVANFALLLFLFIYIFSLLGQFLFANRFRFDPRSGDVVRLGTAGFDDAEVPRENFDNFLSAFVSIFSILMVEAWPSILFSGWRASRAETDAFELIAVLYFVVVVVVGNLVLLSLFLAILLSNFEGLDEEMANAAERLRRKALGTSKKKKKKKKKSSKGGDSVGGSGGSSANGVPIYSEDDSSGDSDDTDGSVAMPFDPALLSSTESEEESEEDQFLEDLQNAP